jgi:hypothetical protein
MFSSSAAAFAGVWNAAGSVRLARSVGDGQPDTRVTKSINIQWVYPPADSAEVLLANVGQLSTSAELRSST